MTMRKRKPFFIRGNFQLKFIFFFVILLMASVFSAVFFIHRSLEGVIEEAAFSSHLSLSSSGELFWRTILQVNLAVAAISVLIGVLIVGWIYFYLENFFRSFVKKLEKLSEGDFAVRIETKKRWWGRQLVADFNAVAGQLEKNSKEVKKITEALITAVDSRPEEALKKIKSLHGSLSKITSH